MGNLRIKKKKALKNDSFSPISIKISLVRQEGLEPPNPWLRRPTTSSLPVLVFIVFIAVFIFPGCDLGAKVSMKTCQKNEKILDA